MTSNTPSTVARSALPREEVRRGERLGCDLSQGALILAEKGFDPQMGARPMARLIQDTIRKALADELLFGRLVNGGRVTVDMDEKDNVAVAIRELAAGETLRVVAPDVGGGFGAKLIVYPEDVLIPFLARRLGRPVRWLEDRLEHMLAATQEREQEHDVTVGFDDTGRILAEAVIPYEADEVTRLIVDTHDKAAFAAAGLFGRQTLGYLLAALPIAGAGLYLGGRIQTGLSQRAFQIVIRVLLLTSGLALLLKR